MTVKRFEFTTANQIIFGAGTLAEIGQVTAGFGRKALLAAGVHNPNLDRVVSLLSASGVTCMHFPVTGEPTVTSIEQGVAAARETGCDVVIGFGGGSSLDTAKAIAAMLTNPGTLLDYLEVIGRGQVLRQVPAPFIAVPTTAGTGSEVTRNAVLAVPEKQVKVSLRSPLMLARSALVDPELTYSLPPEVTAAAGMDALAQVIEPFVSSRANPLTDLYCREGIARAAWALPRAYQDPQDAQAREAMAFASLMGGLALANAGLGAVHGFAGPIGGMFSAPHGAVCAALLPATVAVNLQALAARAPENPALRRYLEVARLVTSLPDATTGDLVRWLEDLRSALHIPGLQDYGITQAAFPVLSEKGAAASSMKANPIPLTGAERMEILERAFA